MKRARLALIVVALVALGLVPPLQARDATIPCIALEPGDAEAPNSWMGESQVWVGKIPGRTGACLDVKLFAPTPEALANTFTAPRPVLVETGGTASGDAAQWAGRYLASRGWLVLTVTPQGQGRSEVVSPDACTPSDDPVSAPTSTCRGYPPVLNVDNFVDAMRSGIDFALSPANPFVADPGAIAVAGHSMGARGASQAQAEDDRIAAVVAWDNLVSDKSGDDGLAMGGGPTAATQAGQVPGRSLPIEPRVPAMGHASDGPGATNVDPGPDVKKTAYEVWRRSGVPSFELVLRDSGHGAWGSAIDAEGSPGDRNHQVILYFTEAWLDLWVLNDPTGYDRLVAPILSGFPAIEGLARSQVMSTTYRSAAFLPDGSIDGREGIDCGDLASNCEINGAVG